VNPPTKALLPIDLTSYPSISDIPDFLLGFLAFDLSKDREVFGI
jgi:hypothetical protein